MDIPPPDPAKLLAFWMEWERGETPPGRVMSNLKTGGLREVLEQLGAPHAVDVSERGGPQVIPRPPGAKQGDPAPWSFLPADQRVVTAQIAA